MNIDEVKVHGYTTQLLANSGEESLVFVFTTQQGGKASIMAVKTQCDGVVEVLQNPVSVLSRELEEWMLGVVASWSGIDIVTLRNNFAPGTLCGFSIS